jgi:hypothetical protein
MAAGGVGDGETGSVSLYNVGNLNKSDVLFFRGLFEAVDTAFCVGATKLRHLPSIQKTRS